MRAINPTLGDEGYEPLGSVLETNTDDWPFLVDSVSAALERRGEQVARLVHPIIGITREDGHIASVSDARNAIHRESVMHFDLARKLTDRELTELEAEIRKVLLAVRSTVTDFGAMTQRVEGMIGLARKASSRYDADEVREAVDFLAWLLRGNFVLLGAREYEIRDDAYRCIPGSGLGILADEERSAYARPVPLSELSEQQRKLATSGELLIVDKANARSPVHRHERMDYVGVRRVSADRRDPRRGAPAGPLHHQGLHRAGERDPGAAPQAAAGARHRGPDRGLARLQERGRPVRHVPEGRAVRRAGRRPAPRRRRAAAPGGHRPRAPARPPRRRRAQRLVHPRAARAIATGRCCRPRAQAVHAPLRSATTSRPSTCSARARGCACTSSSTRLDGLPEIANAELEREVVQLARTWDDALRDALVERYGASRARLLFSIWAAHLPEHYKGYTAPSTGAMDIALLENLAEDGPFEVSLQPLREHTRASRSTCAGRRSSWATRCRCSRTSGCA